MYQQLKWLEKAGKIRDLELQPKFLLQGESLDYSGNKIRAINYIADFKFYDKEQRRVRVIDCKGFRTPVYKIKRKLFNYKYSERGFVLEEEI